MSVNGIEIKVGQKWKTRFGNTVEITEVDGLNSHGDLNYPIVGRDVEDLTRHTWLTNGRNHAGSVSRADLVKLIEDVPQAVELVEAKIFPDIEEEDRAASKVRLGTVFGAEVQLPQPIVGNTKAFTSTGCNAPDLLDAAASHMRDRAATYDKPEGERSIAQVVTAFNAIHGTAMTEVQGWHFMCLLKQVRAFSAPGKAHRDSLEDNIAYSALMGEAMLKGGAQ